MRKPDTILDEVHAIRRKIEERTKGMTTSERTAYFNQRGEAVAKEFGFKIITSINESLGDPRRDTKAN
jgi:hypothetical protein